ncbi:MAG: hypothetical protein RSC29_03395, partial [Oscillospiraceae bacterium]
MKNKRIISIVLVTILTILFIMPTTFAAGISSDVWNSIDNFNNAKKQSNDDDIIKYGKEVFAGLENAEQTTLVKEILSSRYYEVADAYDRRDDFATAAYYYQKYIPYGEFMGWKDGVRIAKSKILQYTETAQMFTETNVPQVYHGS